MRGKVERPIRMEKAVKMRKIARSFIRITQWRGRNQNQLFLRGDADQTLQSGLCLASCHHDKSLRVVIQNVCERIVVN